MSAASERDRRVVEAADEPWTIDRGREVRPWRTERPVDDDPVVIDCDTCAVRGIGCGDCVVTVLLGGPPFGTELNSDEQRALEALAEGGLVPPLRMESEAEVSTEAGVVSGPWPSPER